MTNRIMRSKIRMRICGILTIFFTLSVIGLDFKITEALHLNLFYALILGMIMGMAATSLAVLITNLIEIVYEDWRSGR